MVLAGTPANADLSFVFTGQQDVAVTAPAYTASGTLELSLDFQPLPGRNLTVVHNTGPAFISGTFDGVNQGAVVPLTFNGVTYNYIANYYGGNGRSLVLLWPHLQFLGWGGDTAFAVNPATGSRVTPSLMTNEGGLAGKTVIATASGSEHKLALTVDGKIFSWGSNTYGQLGDPAHASGDVPVPVDTSGALSGKTIVSIAAGTYHNLALSSDGLVFAWGENGLGRLGDGTTQTRRSPVAVDANGALAGKTVVAIAAGQYHSLALTSDGLVFGWGSGFQGQLGNGVQNSQLTPVAVDTSGVLAGKSVIGISSGSNHAIAVTSDGMVASWGENQSGQLGNNSTNPSMVPVQVLATGSLNGKTVIEACAGANFNVALTSDGQVHTWGSNGFGQLGIGSTSNRLVPVLAGGLLTGKIVVSIAAGAAHGIALTSDGQPHVWGRGTGSGMAEYDDFPTPVLSTNLGPAVGKRVAVIFRGGIHALVDPGLPQMRVHPLDLTANVGATARFTAAAIHPFPLSIRWQMSATGEGGPFHDILDEPSATTGTLELADLDSIPDGAAFRAIFTSLSGSTTSNPASLHKTLWPAVFSATSGPLASVLSASVGGNIDPVLEFEPLPGTNLTLIQNIGPGPITGRFTNMPHGATVPLTHDGVTYHYIANYHGGNGRSLVLQWPANQVFGWGTSYSSLFGNITSQTRPIHLPTDGVMAGKTITTISHTGGHVLALTSDGKVFAWGENGKGQLGIGTTTDSNQPVAVDGGALADKTVIAVSAGAFHSLALTSEGRIIVWGELRTGEGTKPSSLLPIEFSPDGPLARENVVAVATGGTFDLALTAGGEIYGWGSNSSSQLGRYSNNTFYYPDPILIGKGEIGSGVVTAIAAGSNHALALTEHGQVYAWGSNQYGSLGIGNETPGFRSTSPVAVVSNGALAGKNVTTIAAVDSRSMVLTSDGRVFGWGINWNGELGTGNTAGSSAPVAVESNGALAGKHTTILACGPAHTAVVNRDGSICAWGDNGSGELGYSGWEDSHVPVTLPTAFLAGALPSALGAGWDTNLLLAGHGAPEITRHPLDLMAAAGQTATFSAATEDPFPFTIRWQASPNGTAGPFTDITGDAGTLVLPGITMAQDGWAYRAVFTSAAGERATTPAVLRVVEWTASLASATSTPFAAERILASGTMDIALAFAPVAGRNITLIHNTGPEFISGAFDNLPQGGVITLTHLGVDYPFIVNYHGGNGRSLELQWPWTSIAGWGSSYGNTPVSVATRPALAAKTITALQAGSGHQLALTTDGKVFGWGSNNSGELGNPLTTSSQIPVPVKVDGALAGKTLVVIASGSSHNLALSSDGEVISWGYNFSGQLGDGSKSNRTEPVTVVANGALTGKTITSIAAGDNHSLALSSDGEVFAWGSNSYGKLGTEAWQDSSVPLPVDTRGVLRGKVVTAISAGHRHSLALTSDGEVFAWGSNSNGQLGNGGETESRPPVRVDTSGALAGKRVVAIAAGEDHSMALTDDGLVFTWGGNWYGQLGDNSGSNSRVPVAVASDGALSGKFVIGISAGIDYCLATTADGLIFSWGLNTSGQLGNGGTPNSPVPVEVVASGVLSGGSVNAIAAGWSRSLALLGVEDGPFVTTAPKSRSFLLGAGAGAVSTAFAAAALDPLPFSIQWQEADPTGDFSDIINNPSATTPTLQLDGLTAAMNGRRYRAVFANDGGTEATAPATLMVTSAASPLVLQSKNTIPFSVDAATIVGSLDVSLGFAPMPGDRLTLVNNTGNGFLEGGFVNLVQGARVELEHAGIIHSFVVDFFGGNGRSLVLHWADTLAAGWGSGSSGQLGNGGNLSSNRIPVAVNSSGPMAGQTLVKLAAGSSHSLALAASGRIFAWGDNTSGRLGNGTTTASNVPVEVDATGFLAGKSVIAIAAGSSHSLALTSEGRIASWGSNSSGVLGAGGTSGSSLKPIAVSTSGVLAGKTVTAISAGQLHSVALVSDGTVVAWGSNSSGQLGTGNTTQSSFPVAVLSDGALAGQKVVAIAAGANHTLALTSDGRVYTWGSNQYGQLGRGSTFPSSSNTPEAITGGGLLFGQPAIAIAAGASHSLALAADGKVYGWGLDSSGQLGTGFLSNRSSPVAVSSTGVLAGKSLVAVAAGGSHSLAIDSNGLAYAWGANSSGQIGDNGFFGAATPVALSTQGAVGSRPIAAIAAGNSHSLAIAGRGVAPTVNLAPVSQTVTTGDTVIFTAAAHGYPAPTVRWQRSVSGPGGSFINISGQTSPTLTLTNVAANQNEYAYRAVFTNLEGVSNSTAATLTVQTTFLSFLASKEMPTDSPPLDDPFQTGIPNLLAYAFDLTPDTPDRTKLPTATMADGRLRISYLRWKNAPDLRYTVEASDKIGNWKSGPGATETVSITSIDNAREQVVEQEILPGSSTSRFLRVRVEVNPP